jgi:predicted nucleic acid-binding protein
MIHLDTSFLIRALVPGSPQDRRLREWLRSGERLHISAIGWTEFLCGPVEPQHIELAGRVVSERLDFTEEGAVLAAELFNRSGRRRGSLTDCMIAATALRHEAQLATVNPDDFRRFDNLHVVSD